MSIHADTPNTAAAPSGGVLVIEDDPDSAQTLRMLLEFFGHRVSTASTGRKGLELAKRLQPRVVLCDIGLPDMDGYAVARALRGDPGIGPTFLVAMTGYGRDEDRERAADAGFDRHLVKPADPEDLKRLLAR